MYTKSDVLQIAKAQMTIDYNCKLSDFKKAENIITENNLKDGRRACFNRDCFLKAASFFGKGIFSASPQILPWCREKFLKQKGEWLFEYERLRTIDEKLKEYGQKIADVHDYFLPNPNFRKIKPSMTVKWYEQEEILEFEGDSRFDEALAFNKDYPDMLAVAAVDHDNIIGMAGASADSEAMWQIGINVMPEYMGRGIGTNLVALLKQEVFRRGKVPFYSTVESHVHSLNVAANAGFFPAWAELYSGLRK